MNYLKMILTRKAPVCEADEGIDLLWDYLGCLYKNGQILKDYELIELPDTYHAYITIADNDALDNKHNNIYVNKYFVEVEKMFDIQFESIGKNLNCNEPCRCSDPTWYMLYTDFTLVDSPIVCGDCGKEVPLYKIPHILSQDEHFDILGWQEIYRCIDKIWMYCLSDRFTFRQLSNPNSQLSKDGLKIRADLEAKLSKPVHYYIYHYNKPMGECPSCGMKWTTSDNKEIVDYKCEHCRLVTDE